MTNLLNLAAADGAGYGVLGVGIGLGLLVMGAAKGIGHIGASAVESTARQPEAQGYIFLQMIISAALIEGFTFFAIIVAQGLGNKFFS